MPCWYISLGLVLAMLILPLIAQAQAATLLMPIGGGYSDIYAGFAQAAVARAKNKLVKILVLPTAYSSNPQTITDAERATNLRDAEQRRFQIEEACKRAAPADVTCRAVTLPVFTRADALDLAARAEFTPDVSAVFMLGGDQTVAMQVIVNTPLESVLTEAYERGAVMAGTSAGGGMQSVTMLGGYNANYAAGNSLDWGAVDVWNSAERRGLSFGIKAAILDQHFFQRGRVGRLLNAIALPDVPHVGVGVDAYTGVNAPNGTRLQDVFGLYTVAVLDAETYHAADAVRYRGPRSTLSLRNVLVHLLAPGKFSYNLTTRQHSLGAPAPNVKRAFDALKLPKGAGPLILSGNVSESLDKNAVLARLVELAGGNPSGIVIVAAGYPSDASARTNANKYAAALGGQPQVIIVSKDATAPVELPQAYGGILVIGRDQSLLKPDALTPLKEAWLAGKPLMADGAAAAVMGVFYSAHPPTPQDAEQAELATQKSFIKGRTTVAPGLKALNLMFEPRVLDDNRWGRLFSLAYNNPKSVAFGLSDNTAIELTAQGARVIGENVVFALDLRTATLALGANDAFVIANGLLDVFAPGDPVAPELADVAALSTRVPTPVLPTATPTPAPTATPTVAPSSTPTPTVTSTPLPTSTPGPTATPVPPPGVQGINPLLGWGALALAAIVLVGGLLLRRMEGGK